MSTTSKTSTFEPVDGMTVTVSDEQTEVSYRGSGNGLLLHQAYLADKLIDRCEAAHDAASAQA